MKVKNWREVGVKGCSCLACRAARALARFKIVPDYPPKKEEK